MFQSFQIQTASASSAAVTSGGVIISAAAYHGKRRDGAVKPVNLVFCGLALAVFAAGMWFFTPPLAFLALLLFFGASCFFVYALLVRLSDGTPFSGAARVLMAVMRCGLLLLLVLFIAGELCIAFGSHSDENVGGADYLIVLGAGVNGDTPSLILVSRLDAAAAYLEQNPDCSAIVSGGRGSGENITEAEAMRRYLERRGIAPERIIMEPLARNTVENLRLSFEIIDGKGGGKTAVLSNDFHLFRTRRIAAAEGREIYAVRADTPRADLAVCYYAREFFALGKLFITLIFT